MTLRIGNREAARLNDNPVYDLLAESLVCADRLNRSDDPSALVQAAVARAYEVAELPDWLPQFETLIEAMSDGQRQPSRTKTTATVSRTKTVKTRILGGAIEPTRPRTPATLSEAS